MVALLDDLRSRLVCRLLREGFAAPHCSGAPITTRAIAIAQPDDSPAPLPATP